MIKSQQEPQFAIDFTSVLWHVSEWNQIFNEKTKKPWLWDKKQQLWDKKLKLRSKIKTDIKAILTKSHCFEVKKEKNKEIKS